MDASTFITSSNFEISEDITIPPLDPNTVNDVIDLTGGTISFTESEALDAMFEASSISDGSDGPVFPSYQPLNEACQAVGGKKASTSALASTVNNTLGVQGEALQFLGQTAKFNSDTTFDLTKETAEQIREAQRTLATGSLSIANTAEKADAGFRFSTSGEWMVGANQINLSSDGTLHWNSPVISSVSSVNNQQAQAFQVTADVKTTTAKNKYEQIKATSTSVSNDRTNVTVNSQVDVANNIDQKAVQEHRVTTARSKVDAAELIDHNSQEAVRITAKGAMHSQASSMSLTSSKGAKSALGSVSDTPGIEGENIVNPDGTSDLVVKNANGQLTTFKNVDTSAQALAEPKWKKVGGANGREEADKAPVNDVGGNGSISITADSGMTTIAEDTVFSSNATAAFLSGSNAIFAAQGGLTQLAKSINISGQTGLGLSVDKGAMILSTGNKGMTIVGGTTFLGGRARKPANTPPLSAAKPIKLRKVPKLPKLPKGITYDQLKECIPEKYLPDEEDTINTPESGNAPTAEEAGQIEKGQPIPGGKEPGAISETNTGEGSSDTPIDDSEEANVSSSKLPNTSPLSENTSPTDPANVETPNKITGAAGVVKGGVDIFPKDSDGEETDPHKREDETFIAPDFEDYPLKATRNTTNEELYNNIFSEFIEQEVEAQIALELGFTQETEDVLIRDFGEVVDENTFRKDLEEYIFNERDSYIREEYTELSITILNEFAKRLIARYTSEGGLIDVLNSAANQVSDTINVVQSSIDDIADSNVVRITRNARDIAQQIPGAAGEFARSVLNPVGGFTDTLTNLDLHQSIEGLLEQSGEIGTLYKGIQYVLDNQDQILDSIGASRLRQEVRTQVQDLLIYTGNPTSFNYNPNAPSEEDLFVDTISNEFLSIGDEQEYKENGITEELINNAITTLENTLPPQPAGSYRQIYTNIESILISVLTNNLSTLIPGSTIESILPYVIGSENAALYFNLKNIYFKGKQIFENAVDIFNDTVDQAEQAFATGQEIYTSMQAIPGYIALMNQYKVPALNQVSSILKCFDLLNQFKNLFNGVKDVVDTARRFADPLRDTLTTLDELFSLFGDDEDENINNVNNVDTTAQNNNLIGLITNGLVDGTINPDVPIRDITDIQNTLINTSPETIDQATEVISNTLQRDNCGNVIFSATANRGHSENPAQWNDKTTDEEIIKLIETLPRLTQILNSIKETPIINNTTPFNSDLTTNQINDIKNTRINIQVDNCFVAPKLNLLESQVEVVQLKNNLMLFKLPNIDLLKYNGKNIFPNNNTIIQIYVEQFFNTKTTNTLKVFRSKEFFSPYVHNFKVMEFKRDRNIGIAQYIPSQPRIYLTDVSGTAFNYGSADIGNKLQPIILDSYLLL